MVWANFSWRSPGPLYLCRGNSGSCHLPEQRGRQRPPLPLWRLYSLNEMVSFNRTKLCSTMPRRFRKCSKNRKTNSIYWHSPRIGRIAILPRICGLRWTDLYEQHRPNDVVFGNCGSSVASIVPNINWHVPTSRCYALSDESPFGGKRKTYIIFDLWWFCFDWSVYNICVSSTLLSVENVVIKKTTREFRINFP